MIYLNIRISYKNMIIFDKESDESARDYAYRTIRDNIISLGLKPGEMVSEQEIAKQMGISRTPVREALIELSKSRLVEIIPQRGSFISKIDYGIIEEVRFLRLTVEIAICELACGYRTEEDINKLEELVSLQEFYYERGVADKLLDFDNKFHNLLYEIGNKNLVRKIVQDTTVHFDRVRRLSYTTVKDTKIIKDHKELIIAVKNQDKELAKQVMTKHLLRYKLDEELIRKEYPHYLI